MKLREALDQMPDHRKNQGRRHPLGRFELGRLRDAVQRPQFVCYRPVGTKSGSQDG